MLELKSAREEENASCRLPLSIIEEICTRENIKKNFNSVGKYYTHRTLKVFFCFLTFSKLNRDALNFAQRDICVRPTTLSIHPVNYRIKQRDKKQMNKCTSITARPSAERRGNYRSAQNSLFLSKIKSVFRACIKCSSIYTSVNFSFDIAIISNCSPRVLFIVRERVQYNNTT